MVSAGDTAISLHIRAPQNGWGWGEGGPDQLNQKCQDLSKFTLGGGRCWGDPDQYLSGALNEFLTKISTRPLQLATALQIV